jgi:hypothetical protein
VDVAQRALDPEAIFEARDRGVGESFLELLSRPLID